MNVHPAVLPVGRGPWPQPMTILKGLKESGITLHKLSENFDEGDIVLQKKFRIEVKENLETLTEKNAYYAKKVTEEFFSDFDNLIKNCVRQPKGEYWPEPTADDMCFSLNDEYAKIDKTLRAFYGFGCKMITENGAVKIKKGIILKQRDKLYDGFDCYGVKDGCVIVLEYA